MDTVQDDEIMEILGAGNGAAVDLSCEPVIESAEEEMERQQQQRAQKRKERNEKLRQRMKGRDVTSAKNRDPKTGKIYTSSTYSSFQIFVIFLLI